MTKTRDIHYVPEWYQRGFLARPNDFLAYLDLKPDRTFRPDGKIIPITNPRTLPVARCFFEPDLYTTFFGVHINDEIERKLFGKIDNAGSRAIRAFIGKDVVKWHQHFTNFFEYIDAQKLRTQKGLQWIKKHYPQLNQLELMLEMQGIRNINCAIWTEGVREIVSAENSELKFILSDHPVTTYNSAYSPESEECSYPNDPAIDLKGTQTIFPLDKNHCLILTNYEYAKDPPTANPTDRRTNPQYFRRSLVRTDKFIRTRSLKLAEVERINFIIKSRARRYVAAAHEGWLYPERNVKDQWFEVGKVLLPSESELWGFGGETFIGYEDGRTDYQDAFGRTSPENPHLKKVRNKNLKPNEPCGCGSGQKYKKCCANRTESERPSWDELSVRERNIIFLRGVYDILGLSNGKSWDDVRKELSDDQVKRIHELYGFLWPRETDILALLSKPDNKFRALYTGIIDSRLITSSAISSLLYFEELIIQSPFLNPNVINPKFSPVIAPHQHKLQTLKNVLLLLVLEPFIVAGYINFIPDPCAFNEYMQRQILDLAERRSGKVHIDERDRQILDWLAKDEFERTVYMGSQEQQKQQIRRSNPHLTEDEINNVLSFMAKKRMSDPFALLQEDIFAGGKEGGQLTMMSMIPNFEMSLVLAQATGACLLTDSYYRWNEISAAQRQKNGAAIYDWPKVTNFMNKVEYIMNANPTYTLKLRRAGVLAQSRKLTKDIHLAIRMETDRTKIESLSASLEKQFADTHEASQRKLTNLDGLTQEEVQDAKQYNFKRKFVCLAPRGGMVHNNSQRILLSAGSRKHLQSVPMAIFMEPAQSPN